MFVFLEKISLKKNLSFMFFVAITGLCFVIIQGMMMLHHELVDDRKIKTQHVVESAYGIMSYYGTRAQNGEISQEDAKLRTFEAIESLRYGGSEYFWISGMDASIIMHPIKPKLNGTDGSQIKDPNGTLLFIDMANIVRDKGEGFISYMWPKPGREKPVEKISYVKGYAPWGWIIGSGIYLDDVNAIFQDRLVFLIFGALVCIAALLCVGTIIARAITRPLNELRQTMSLVSSKNDLTIRSQLKSSNEAGEISNSFNVLMDSVHNTMLRVKESYHETTVALEKMDEHINVADQSAAIARDRTNIVSLATSEMVSALRQVAQSSANAAQTTQTAEQETKSGQDIVDISVKKIENLAVEINSAGVVIQELNAEVNNITQVVDVISGIAEQTNLLALNAAIEAARAGEQGRGFAVVADEVRSLAQRTKVSTLEILTIIQALQSKSEDAVEIFRVGQRSANDSVDQAVLAGEKLASIAEQVVQLAEMNITVAASSEEQQATINEINHSIEAIVDATKASSDSATLTSDTNKRITELAQQLNSNINRFQIN